MILTPKETDRFYRIWWAILRYTNSKLHLIPDLPASPAEGSIPIAEAAKIRQALWEDDSLREAFIAENPAGLPPEDLEIVASWQYRVAGNFYVLRHLKKYSIFLTEGTHARAYGVVGLLSPIEEVIGPYLPVYVQAILLPFGDKITYDSLLSSYNIFFGSGIRGDLNMAYRDAEEREGIITSLLPQAEPPTADEVTRDVRARNAKILKAFEKDLYKSGLSPKMVEKHTSNIETFANTYLIEQEPPRPVLEIEAKDLEAYLASRTFGSAEEKTNITSFKRFVRFLYESARIDPDAAWDLQNFVKLYRRGRTQ